MGQEGLGQNEKDSRVKNEFDHLIKYIDNPSNEASRFIKAAFDNLNLNIDQKTRLYNNLGGSFSILMGGIKSGSENLDKFNDAIVVLAINENYQSQERIMDAKNTLYEIMTD